ncbi:alpha-L-rhamnosidase [Prevotella sp. 10(H)]|uniref:alpha-L-rhamnosidase n=1 Tax=Prevotella sp. 10(H) TaxID=1158294 RepID=UPI00068FD32E|nr:alpha-L-rhamnosidase [Prevotella sp. 10(H)]
MKTSLKLTILIIFSFIFCSTGTAKNGSDIEITNLRCELIKNPKGIDITTPRLSWELISDKKSVLQTSCHILVASSLEKLNANEGDLWDSKQVKSDMSILVPYQGRPLESRMECYWKVRVTTNKGKSDWSQPACWTMGLLTPDEWQARWIGLDKTYEWENPEGDNTRMGARYFRKEFQAAKQIEKATLYICGLGLYKLHINGDVIGTQELSPTPTDYRKEVKYNTFDVTENLQQGKNAVGVVLGNGRFFHMRKSIPFQYPKMIFHLELEYKDGGKQIVVSDNTWKVTADGPIRANNEYDGEEYDARKEMPGWDKPDFDDKRWLTIEPITPPEGELNAQLNPNIQVMDIVRPIGIKELEKGKYILDMGQNMVGWLKMKVKGNRGEQVQLRFAEFLNDDGSINQENLRGALATDKYTLKGGGEEVWEPYFTSHGFRFVEIMGYPGTPSIKDFEGRVVYDEMEQTGTFETSNALINQIYKNSYWSIRGNYRGVPTDCPQRAERMGWTGDRAIGSYGESFIFDNHSLYSKWVNDIKITQKESGSVSDIAPSYWSHYTDNMTWPGTYLMVANMLYEQYGDKEPIVKHYDSMKKWLYYMRDKYLTADNIMPRDQYGDWCTPPEDPTFNDPKDPNLITDKELIGTSYYFYMLRLLEKFALMLNKPADAKEYEGQAVKVKEAYNAKFLNKEKGYYSTNTVTANVLSLSFGLVPDEYKKVVFGNMKNRTTGEFKGHVSSGIIGCQWLMREFTKNGSPEVAYEMLLKTDYPSFGYMIGKGATTIWEHWNGDGMAKWIDSQNHVMQLGDLIIWFYEDLAGIKNTSGNYGFKKITMKPQIINGLDMAKGTFHSVHGMIKSSWKKDRSSFKWDITVPCNTTATVYIPAVSQTSVKESGKKPSSKDIKFIKMEGQYAVFEVGSGSYSFLTNN